MQEVARCTKHGQDSDDGDQENDAIELACREERDHPLRDLNPTPRGVVVTRHNVQSTTIVWMHDLRNYRSKTEQSDAEAKCKALEQELNEMNKRVLRSDP